MKNIEYLQFNAFCDSDDGKRHYRAVNVYDNGKSVWRLCIEIKPAKQWDFINSVLYPSAYDAFLAITD